MEGALDRIRKEAAGSEDARREVIAALQSLASSLETPDDALHRFGHMVAFPLPPKVLTENQANGKEQGLQTATVQVGINLGLFRHLVEASQPLSVNSIAETTEASPQLICEY